MILSPDIFLIAMMVVVIINLALTIYSYLSNRSSFEDMIYRYSRLKNKQSEKIAKLVLEIEAQEREIKSMRTFTQSARLDLGNKLKMLEYKFESYVAAADNRFEEEVMKRKKGRKKKVNNEVGCRDTDKTK